MQIVSQCTKFKTEPVLTVLEMYPFPSRSYILKAHLSLSSSFPRDVTDNAHMNSENEEVMFVLSQYRDFDSFGWKHFCKTTRC